MGEGNGPEKLEQASQTFIHSVVSLYVCMSDILINHLSCRMNCQLSYNPLLRHIACDIGSIVKHDMID